MASEYLAIYMAGLVGMFLYNVASAILRGLGDSRTLAVPSLCYIPEHRPGSALDLRPRTTPHGVAGVAWLQSLPKACPLLYL